VVKFRPSDAGIRSGDTDSKPKVGFVRNGHRGWCSKGYNLSLGRSAEDTDDFQSERGNRKSSRLLFTVRRVESSVNTPKRPGGRTSWVTLKYGEPSVLEWLVFQLKRISPQRSCVE
jgi:hypothetical protein